MRPIDEDRALINFSFTNLFEAKYFSRRDSTEKKLKLFDNISVSGNYNMAAEYNQWSPINISGNTRFFKGVTTVTVGASYSFYALRENGTLDTLFYSQTNNQLLRFDNLRLRFSSRITYQDIAGLFSKKEPGSDARTGPNDGGSTRLPAARDKFFDLLSRFSINHELGVMRIGMTGRDTTILTTNSINLVGSMQGDTQLVTDFWKHRLRFPLQTIDLS